MPTPSFLQSLEWEQFQRLLGRKTWRARGALVIRHELPWGFNYLYCPRPEGGTNQEAGSREFFDEVKPIAKQEKSIFLKIDPAQKSYQLSAISYQPSDSIQPRQTIILDLIRSEEDLLAAMRQKTRYNIRLAERKGARITDNKWQTANSKPFWDLLQKTAQRDRFRLHERKYYEKLFVIQSNDFSNELFFAEYQGNILAAALVNFYQPAHTATYLHGASSREHREVMAPYLLHWRIIKEAKKRGFHTYDFWGIDEKKWPGLTRFKKGFGGVIKEYPESIDVVYGAFFYRTYQAVRYLIKS